MRIVIPGGTGQLGTVQARAFHERGDEVIVLSRHRQKERWPAVEWDEVNFGEVNLQS